MSKEKEQNQEWAATTISRRSFLKGVGTGFIQLRSQLNQSKCRAMGYRLFSLMRTAQRCGRIRLLSVRGSGNG